MLNLPPFVMSAIDLARQRVLSNNRITLIIQQGAFTATNNLRKLWVQNDLQKRHQLLNIAQTAYQ